MVQKRKSRLMGFEEFMQLSEKTEKENAEKAELGKFLEEHNRLHALHTDKEKDFLINEQLLKTEKENAEKAEFFQHLNNVMANKLLKPSIIMEYVNQYNISMGEE
tara:strand:+ start:3931 stop:4245 length:315 start_codon:yes stop_codon:yes gene_type:complete